MAFDPAQAPALLDKLDSNLRFLFCDRNVPEIIQAQLAHAGFTTLSVFSLMGDDRKMVRETLRDPPFDLNPAEGDIDAADKTRRRSAQARAIDALEAAGKRVAEKSDVEAKQRAKGEHIALPLDEHVNLRRNLEKGHGELKDAEYPSHNMIEARFEEVETGLLKAESLEYVVSTQEATTQSETICMGKDGTLEQKGLSEGPAPDRPRGATC